MDAPLAIVIPTLNAASGLSETLKSLETGRDLIAEIVVCDSGSTDKTVEIAQAGGAQIVIAARGRGAQLRAGAVATSAPWLLFLHADTRLEDGWADAVSHFIARPESAERLGHFIFHLDETDPAMAEKARRLERMVAWRSDHFKLPYGDQGLVVSRDFYERLGGYDPVPLMEDVQLVQRAVLGYGRRTIAALDRKATTSASRFRRDGYLKRPLRNICCLVLWKLGVPVRVLVRLYG